MSAQPETPEDAPPVKRGRGRPALARDTVLELDEILDKAFAIIDRDGLDALSMRQLADELGVTVKALYNHVTNKAALIQALVDRVWDVIFAGVEAEPGNLEEWLIQLQVRTRRVWLDNLDLATAAMAVAERNEDLLYGCITSVQVIRTLGAQDVGLLYNVLQTYTFGSIAVAASRRRNSLYIGRNPDTALADACALVDAADIGSIGDDVKAVMEAQLDEGDERHFETGLRILFDALVAYRPEP